MKVGWHWKRH